MNYCKASPSACQSWLVKKYLKSSGVDSMRGAHSLELIQDSVIMTKIYIIGNDKILADECQILVQRPHRVDKIKQI